MKSYYIDAIARDLERDVLMLSFIPLKDEFGCPNWMHPEELEKLPRRIKAIKWLDQNHIAWRPCGEFWDGRSYLSYPGHIYIAVVPSLSNPDFIKLRDYFVNQDGSMRHEGVCFWIVSLSKALENSHHDHPDYFWD